MDIGTLAGRITLEDQMTAVLNRVNVALDTVENKLKNTSTFVDRVGDGMSRAGRAMTIGLTAPIAAAATASLLMAGNFETSITRMNTLAGVAEGKIDAVRDGILELAPAVGIGPQRLADAMTRISSTVSDADVALEILEGSAKASAAGLGEAVDVAGAITAVINSYGASNITAARATSVLTQAVKDGGAEAKELAPTLANVVPLAAQMGISFEEVGANIATMTKLGMPAAEAVTTLSSVMTALLKETNQGKEALARIGMTFGELRQEVREKGLAAALTDLTARVGENKEVMVDIFGRVEAVRNVMGTAGQQAETYAEVLGKVTKAGQDANVHLKAFDAITHNQTFTWAQLNAEIGVAAIKFGNQLAPALKIVLDNTKPLVSSAIELIDAFSKLSPTIQMGTIGFGALVLGLGPVMWSIGSIIQSMKLFVPAFEMAAKGATALFWPIKLLSDQIAIFGVQVGVTTTAKLLWSKATTVVTGAVTRLWAVIAAHPLIALVTAIGLVTTAVVKWKESQAQLLVDQQELAAKQDTIAAAIARGANQQIKYAEAIEYNEQWVRKLNDPLNQLNTRLKEMQDNGAPATDQLNVMAEAAIKLGSQGRLGSTQMAELAEKIKATGVETSRLPEPLRNIVTALEIMANKGKAVSQTTIISDEQRKAAEDYAKKLAEVNQKLADLAGPKGKLSASQQNDAIIYQRQGLSIEDIAIKLNMSKIAVDKFLDSHASMIRSMNENVIVSKPLEESLARVGERTNFLTDTHLTGSLNSKIYASGIFDVKAALDSASASAQSLAEETKEFEDQWADQGPTLEQLGYKAGKTFSESMMDNVRQIPQMMAQAMTGGGGVLGAAQGIGSMLGSTIGNQIGKTISTLGTLGGPIGAAIGSLAGPLIGLIANIGGPSKQELAGRGVTADFTKSFGGSDKMIGEVGRVYAAMGKSADEARSHIKAMWDAEKQGAEATQAARDRIQSVFDDYAERLETIDNGVDDVTSAFREAGDYIPTALRDSIAALAEMNGLTEEQRDALRGIVEEAAPNYQKLTEEAKGYGITLDNLGPIFQQNIVNADTKKLVDFFNKMKDAGADVGGMLQGMSDEISKVVQNSIKFKTTIPENMKHMIEELARTGQLTDENGNKIEDLSGITFAESPLDKSLNTLKTTVERLAEVLSRIPGVARDAANAIGDIPQPPGVPTYADPNWESRANGGLGYDVPAMHMDQGGQGRARGPMVFTTNGNEDFWFGGENRPSIFSGGSSTANGTSGGGTVIINLDSQRMAEILMPKIAGMIEEYGLR